MQRALSVALGLCLLALPVLAISPPWHYRAWSGELGVLLPGDTLRTETISVDRCGSGIWVPLAGYGSDSVSVLMEESLDGVNWVAVVDTYPTDFSATPVAPNTTVEIGNLAIAADASFRNRPWGTKHLRFVIGNGSAVDTVRGLGVAVCARCN